jgi:hypothetical protein
MNEKCLALRMNKTLLLKNFTNINNFNRAKTENHGHGCG